MTWNYRVLEREGELAIHEVYYYEDGSVEGYSEVPAFPRGQNLEELKADLEKYSSALLKPVLNP